MELFSPGHLIVLAIVVAILFFGWKQLPDMSRSLGRSLRIFKTEIKGMSEDDKARDAAREADRPAIEAAPTAQVTAPGAQPVPPAQSAPPVEPVQAQAVPARPRPRPQGSDPA